MSRSKMVLAAGLAAIGVAACGGTSSGGGFTQVAGPWTAAQQGDFEGGCDADGGSSAYCVCALKDVMQMDPTPSMLGSGAAGMSVETLGGQTAALKKGDFPDCEGK